MNCSVSIQRKVLSLRAKYRKEGNKARDDALSRVIWGSFPVLYPHYDRDFKRAELNRAKVIQKRKRYRKYVRDMIATFSNDFRGNFYLISLTFTDDVLAKTIRETRDKYCRDYLNSICLDYFACIDFGAKDGREHYHAIAFVSAPMGKTSEVQHGRKKFRFFEPSEPSQRWKYGFSSFRPMKVDKKDVYRSCAYALKASDYAFKSADESTGIKPFHKRGVLHLQEIEDFEQLPF